MSSAPMNPLAVVPRPVRGQLPIWLGTGGSAPSSARAGKLGLPVSYGIIGGTQPGSLLGRDAAEDLARFDVAFQESFLGLVG